jgi:hypothetical protein
MHFYLGPVFDKLKAICEGARPRNNVYSQSTQREWRLDNWEPDGPDI